MEREQLIRLVNGAQKGDHTAMDELFAAFYNDVYYFALKTVKDSDWPAISRRKHFWK